MRKVELEELFRCSDIISVQMPLTKENHHMINDHLLSLMKPTAYLVNCGRGPLVDEEALIRVLREGKIAGAALDTVEQEPLSMDSELRKLDNVLLTPHAAWYSEESSVRLQRGPAEELVRVLTGKAPKNPVNLAYFPSDT